MALRLETDVQAIEQKLRLDHERIIRQKTIDIENEMNRLNQELQFAKNNENLVINENEKMKEQLKRMAFTLTESNYLKIVVVN